MRRYEVYTDKEVHFKGNIYEFIKFAIWGEVIDNIKNIDIR